MISWTKNNNGRIRGMLRGFIVYEQRTDGDISVWSETDTSDNGIKFRFKLKR